MNDTNAPCAPIEDAEDNELLKETDADYSAEEQNAKEAN